LKIFFQKLENLHENIPLQFSKAKRCEDLLQKILDLTQDKEVKVVELEFRNLKQNWIFFLKKSWNLKQKRCCLFYFLV
jgi:hypothetical protein